MIRGAWILLCAVCASCLVAESKTGTEFVKPRVVSGPVKHDSDDPAIWVDRKNPANSLVLYNIGKAFLYLFNRMAVSYRASLLKD